METHVELSRKHNEDLVEINALLIDLPQRQVELRLAALRDRLADTEKLKIRYQRQVDLLFVESYRSGWENREFEGHTEVMTLDQFDEQKSIERDHYYVRYYMQQLGDEINIAYPVDVLKMLDEEKDGPVTSASFVKEIVPAFGLPEQSAEVPGGQLGPNASTGGGSSTVVLSSNDSKPDVSFSTEAGLSIEAGVPPPVGGSDIIYDAIPFSVVWPTSGSGPIVYGLELFVNSPRAMTDKICSG
ncbi:hypothetical protein PanWU01x14_329040, partial [Parasponia andersonii]